ncbi:SIR2 family protein [Pantoea ananatis]
MIDDFDYDGLEQKKNLLAIDSFEELRLKFHGKRICLFLGAGFSKAWDESYPLSDDIFSITEKEAKENVKKYSFFSLFEALNLKWAEENASLKDKASVFKTFKYNIDIYKRYPSLLPSHLDKQTMDLFEKQIKLYIKNKFSTLIDPSEFSLTSKGGLKKEKTSIIKFFKSLMEGSSLDVITTNYDIVIDKVLRRAVPDKTILRGFPVHFNKELQCPKRGGIGLYKLNGGFEIIPDGDGFNVDYDSLNNKQKSPNIILPSNDQDYGDKYFKNAFIKSSGQLRNADILIFIGYSFPEEDYVIQFLLKTFLDVDNFDKETVIISRNEKSAIDCHERACKVFTELNDKSGLYYFKGSFLDLCSELK